MSAPPSAPPLAPRGPGWRPSVAVAFAMSLAGCAVPEGRALRPDAHHPQPVWGQVMRERTFQHEWRGKSYERLVENLGTPLRKLEIPGRDPALTWTAVYGMRDARAGCVDAFTIMVVDGEERVVDYFCR